MNFSHLFLRISPIPDACKFNRKFKGTSWRLKEIGNSSIVAPVEKLTNGARALLPFFFCRRRRVAGTSEHGENGRAEEIEERRARTKTSRFHVCDITVNLGRGISSVAKERKREREGLKARRRCFDESDKQNAQGTVAGKEVSSRKEERKKKGQKPREQSESNDAASEEIMSEVKRRNVKSGHEARITIGNGVHVAIVR